MTKLLIKIVLEQTLKYKEGEFDLKKRGVCKEILYNCVENED